MTDRELLKELVRFIGALTMGEERWVANGDEWFDRVEHDFIRNEELARRLHEALAISYENLLAGK